MNGWENSTYVLALVISNVAALLILFCCWKNPRAGRFLFFLLFSWAGYTNWKTALHTPQFYLDYADLAFLPFYTTFIKGWFSRHILLLVGAIASGQLLIAVSMWLRGWIFKLGTIGGIIFLLAILPLGVGAGFPFPIIAALAFYLLLKHPSIDYLWKRNVTTVYAVH
jgi:hypothetical protein